MIKDCFRYDGVINDIRFADGRVKIKLAAEARTHVAAMGKYNPDAATKPCRKTVRVDEKQDGFKQDILEKIKLLKCGSTMSVFVNIDENNKTFVQLMI